MDDISKELSAFLNYVVGKESDDAFVRKLEDAEIVKAIVKIYGVSETEAEHYL